jgi:tetratricopeptide (TPR) repeat protein
MILSRRPRLWTAVLKAGERPNAGGWMMLSIWRKVTNDPGEAKRQIWKCAATHGILFLVPLMFVVGLLGCLSPVSRHLTQGAAAYNRADYDKAITELTLAIEISPRLRTAYSFRGSSYYRKGQYDLAISDFNKVIQLEPGHPADYDERGQVYLARGDHALAKEDFDEAIELSLGNPIYYDHRGLAYHASGQYDSALKDFTVAIQIAPRDPTWYSNRAETYIATGQISLAIADINKTIELSDDPALSQRARERLRSLEQWHGH